MAIGWFNVLKMVPWGDVIENAPKVAQGAKKLWSTVGKKAAGGDAAADTTTPQGDATAVADTLPALQGQVAALRSQVAGLQVDVAELHQQMVDSSALIQSLAEQNTQLIRRIELMRRRLLWLAAALLGLAVWLVLRLY